MSRMPIGAVAEVWRYPVKSMRGEPLAAAEIGWHGVEGDRRAAFVRAANRSRFPWLTGREAPELLLHEARWVDPASPRSSAIRVRTPEGDELPLESEEQRGRLENAAGEDVRLLTLGRGAFDSMPVSVLTAGTAASLSDALGAACDPRRFRANLLLDAAAVPPHGERDWLGARLVIGEGERAVRLRVDRRIERCVMITLDPDSASRAPGLLRAVAERAETCIGVYATTERPGEVRPGDPVILTRD
jgi:uncharacterized protein YcbX